MSDPYTRTEPLRLALFTDVHHDIMHDGPKRLQSFADAATQAQVDMAVQLGDFCQPTDANRAFLDIWLGLETPRYNVLGNHDMDGGFSRQQAVDYMSMPHRYYSFDRKGWHGVVLDGNDPSDPPRSGYACGVAADQIDWLRQDLQGTQLPVIIFIHQSIDRPDLDGGTEVLSALEAANRKAGWQQVVAVFSGHHHLDYATCIQGVWHIQVNSMSNYWMGDDYKQIRYGEQVDAAHPYIKYTAPYKDPLFALVKLQPGGVINIQGVDSEWVGNSPEELGYMKNEGAALPLKGASLQPRISSRHLGPSAWNR